MNQNQRLVHIPDKTQPKKSFLFPSSELKHKQNNFSSLSSLSNVNDAVI